MLSCQGSRTGRSCCHATTTQFRALRNHLEVRGIRLLYLARPLSLFLQQVPTVVLEFRKLSPPRLPGVAILLQQTCQLGTLFLLCCQVSYIWSHLEMGPSTHNVPWLLAPIHVGEELPEFAPFQGLGPLEGFHDICLEPDLELFLCLSVPPPLRLHKETEPCDWVVNTFAVLDFLSRAVCERVVRSRMMTDTIKTLISGYGTIKSGKL